MNWIDKTARVSHPMRVIAVANEEFDIDFGLAIDDSVARMDDAYWARYVRLPLTWQRYLDWWVARRWVIPRDVRKQ